MVPDPEGWLERDGQRYRLEPTRGGGGIGVQQLDIVVSTGASSSRMRAASSTPPPAAAPSSRAASTSWSATRTASASTGSRRPNWPP
jgi:hypothetical protein